MHIGFFTDGFTPQLNGVATSLELLASVLEEQGHTVSIFAPKMGGYHDRRQRVYRLPSFKAMKDPPLWLAAPVSRRVLRSAHGLQLDIVHSHTPFALHLLAFQLARQEHLPIVYTYHTLLPAHVNTIRVLSHVGASPRIAERFSVWTSDMVDHVIAPSEKIKELLERYGVRRPITVVHNGIEVERFRDSERGYLHGLLGLPPTARILLVVGRLTQEKNVSFLVRVLARIHQTHKNVYVVPVGQGPLRATLQDQAARLGVGEYLRFTGPLPPTDMPRVYADADLYLSASFSEAHSMAALEALASGLPLVVVPDQSLTMMVREGENGYVVGLDEAAFAGAILAILDNPDLHASMSACSIELSNAFSVQMQAQNLVKLYEQVIAEKRLQRQTAS